jgi:peroxin-12
MQEISRTEWIRRFARWLFKQCYPWMNAVYHVASWGYSVAYLAEQTRYYAPWFHLLGIEIRRMSLQDYVPVSLSVLFSQVVCFDTPFPSHFTPLQNRPSSNVARTRRKLGFHILGTILSNSIEFLKILLPMSIFFFKFLEWWYSSDYARLAGGDEVHVPPPEKLQVSPT